MFSFHIYFEVQQNAHLFMTLMCCGRTFKLKGSALITRSIESAASLGVVGKERLDNCFETST
jgi:hypothetical protein